jgi:hypothetical protein
MRILILIIIAQSLTLQAQSDPRPRPLGTPTYDAKFFEASGVWDDCQGLARRGIPTYTKNISDACQKAAAANSKTAIVGLADDRSIKATVNSRGECTVELRDPSSKTPRPEISFSTDSSRTTISNSKYSTDFDQCSEYYDQITKSGLDPRYCSDKWKDSSFEFIDSIGRINFCLENYPPFKRLSCEGREAQRGNNPRPRPRTTTIQ